jgi:hypothetical protein
MVLANKQNKSHGPPKTSYPPPSTVSLFFGVLFGRAASPEKKGKKWRSIELKK